VGLSTLWDELAHPFFVRKINFEDFFLKILKKIILKTFKNFKFNFAKSVQL